MVERRNRGDLSPLDVPGTEGIGRWPRNVIWGVFYSLSVALVFCGYVMVLYFVRGAAPFTANDTTLGGVLAAYVGSAILVGIVLGTFRPLLRHVLGVVVVGWICAAVVFLGIRVAVEGPANWGPDDLRAAGILGLIFGPAGALIFRWYGKKLSDDLDV